MKTLSETIALASCFLDSIMEYPDKGKKSVVMRTWVLIALLLGVALPSVQARIGDVIGIGVTNRYNVAGGDTPLGKPVQAKLNAIVLHGFDFENEDISKVLKELSEQSKRLDPEHIGVEIQLDLSAERTLKNFPVRRTVNMKTGEEMCLANALAYVCMMTHLGFRIVDGVVIMEPI